MATEIHHVYGAALTDQVMSITLKTGEFVVWNVTKLIRAAAEGEFGPPVYARTADLGAADWSNWDAVDRIKVNSIKASPAALESPAIAIQSPIPEYAILCFADGQHRVTARQELGLPEVAFYVVPTAREAEFRVTGLPKLADE